MVFKKLRDTMLDFNYKDTEILFKRAMEFDEPIQEYMESKGISIQGFDEEKWKGMIASRMTLVIKDLCDAADRMHPGNMDIDDMVKQFNVERTKVADELENDEPNTSNKEK